MSWEDYIPKDIQELYEIHEFKHAAAILAKEFPKEFDELCNVLREIRFTKNDIIKSGGNQSLIPKLFKAILEPLGWIEKQLKAELIVYESDKNSKNQAKEKLNHGTHKVDFIKGRIAFDVEWNSKDQTFDRDLYAFRGFFEYNAISLGVLVTRSKSLDPLFKQLGIQHKYGASTTQMGKLLPRLEAGRNGGCPILVFGITTKQIID